MGDNCSLEALVVGSTSVLFGEPAESVRGSRGGCAEGQLSSSKGSAVGAQLGRKIGILEQGLDCVRDIFDIANADGNSVDLVFEVIPKWPDIAEDLWLAQQHGNDRRDVARTAVFIEDQY